MPSVVEHVSDPYNLRSQHTSENGLMIC